MSQTKIHMNKVSKNIQNFLSKWDFESKFLQVPRDRLVVERRVMLVLRVDPLRACSFSARLCG